MEDRILIVSASEKSADTLTHILKRCGWSEIDRALGGASCKRLAMRTIYDLIIINAPLKDCHGSDLAADFVNETNTSVVLIVKSDILEITESKVEDDGVIVVPKPLQQRDFLRAVRLSLANRRRMKRLIENSMKFEKKYEELRLVSRAKCVLIEKQNMTEQEAHRFIEKQAMDKRESKSIIAADIIKNNM